MDFSLSDLGKRIVRFLLNIGVPRERMIALAQELVHLFISRRPPRFERLRKLFVKELDESIASDLNEYFDLLQKKGDL